VPLLAIGTVSRAFYGGEAVEKLRASDSPREWMRAARRARAVALYALPSECWPKSKICTIHGSGTAVAARASLKNRVTIWELFE